MRVQGSPSLLGMAGAEGLAWKPKAATPTPHCGWRQFCRPGTSLPSRILAPAKGSAGCSHHGPQAAK